MNEAEVRADAARPDVAPHSGFTPARVVKQFLRLSRTWWASLTIALTLAGIFAAAAPIDGRHSWTPQPANVLATVSEGPKGPSIRVLRAADPVIHPVVACWRCRTRWSIFQPFVTETYRATVIDPEQTLSDTRRATALAATLACLRGLGGWERRAAICLQAGDYEESVPYCAGLGLCALVAALSALLLHSLGWAVDLLRRWRRHLMTPLRLRTLARGRCPSCGYSIRGLPQPRCPECGDDLTFTPATLPDT